MKQIKFSTVAFVLALCAAISATPAAMAAARQKAEIGKAAPQMGCTICDIYCCYVKPH